MKSRTDAPPFGSKPSRLSRIFIVIGLAAVLLFVSGTVFWYNGFGFPSDAALIVSRQTDDCLLLSWPAVEEAESYHVQVSSPDGEIYQGDVQNPGCSVPAASGKLSIRIQPVRKSGRGAARKWVIHSTESVPWPTLSSFQACVDEDAGGIQFHWNGTEGEVFILYQEKDGLYYAADQTTAETYDLPVGESGEIPLPSYQENLLFAGGYAVRDGNILYCSALSQPVSFQRSDFLGTEIKLRAAAESENIYTFQWNEARGNGYFLQYCTDLKTEWSTLATVEPAEEPSCRIKLASGTNYRLRVVGIGEASPTDASGWLSQSSELSLTTEPSVLFATVWLIQDLDIYQDTDRQEIIGTAAAATAYCVLEESDGLFQIRTPDGYGYIDSGYCLINLPDYLGELCAYNITNSYDSLYMVHGYEIPDITGTVITGYEYVQTAQETYLVPLLYPSAKKLAAAAQNTLKDGYRLKIYDAYRPRQASTEIYQITQRHLEDPIPDTTYNGIPMDDLPAGIPLLSELETSSKTAPAQEFSQNRPETSLATENTQAASSSPETAISAIPGSSASPTQAPESVPAAGPEEPIVSATEDASAEETSPEIQDQPDLYLTYSILMTNGGYRLGSFLAMNGSTHNLGIAMDLTLERADTREELKMQTAIHDLSHYAVLRNNNDAANQLADYMLDAGFSPLSTEWWHFQDDATRDALSLTTYQEQGISLEGWHKDLTGWYYCQQNGDRIRSQTVTLHGQSYTFDREGYVMEG